MVNHALDLGEDAVGLVVPFLGSGKKYFKSGIKRLVGKYSMIEKVSDIIESKALPANDKKRTISLLSKINRVARLKKNFK